MCQGSADAPGANCSVKMIESDGSADGVKKAEGLKIKVRLTEAQARARLRGICEKKGVDFEQVSNLKNVKYSPLRVQSKRTVVLRTVVLRGGKTTCFAQYG